MWSIMAGSFSTLCKAEVGITLPELNTTAHISVPFYVTDQNNKLQHNFWHRFT